MSLARSSHSCGRAGHYVFVVGGNPRDTSGKTSEIFSLDSLTWTTGPGVPPTANGELASSAVYQLEDTFYLFGGIADQEIDTIYELDIEYFTWKEREERMEKPRFYHALVPIPNRFLREL